MNDVFHCKHGTFCVTATARCDDIDDCGDYSDETGCGRLISENVTHRINQQT